MRQHDGMSGCGGGATSDPVSVLSGQVQSLRTQLAVMASLLLNERAHAAGLEAVIDEIRRSDVASGLFNPVVITAREVLSPVEIVYRDATERARGTDLIPAPVGVLG